MTKFQGTLLKDLENCWQIVKVFHPTLKEEDRVRMKVKKGSSYQWVQIEFRVKGYGRISIGVSNVHNSSVFGRGIHEGKPNNLFQRRNIRSYTGRRR